MVFSEQLFMPAHALDLDAIARSQVLHSRFEERFHAPITAVMIRNTAAEA